MNDNSASGGTTFLLQRLQQSPRDRQAWEDLVSRYSPEIYRWARRRGLQDADAQDLTQNVFANLLEALHQFDR
jgi:RNA polymerase sigma-70 factor (ECF subfamily)